ncbi:hypothetical protein E4T56_gene15226, partial [Termitomyces sp. T112]
DDELDDTDNIYQGGDTPYLKNPRVRCIVDDLKDWPAWYCIGPADQYAAEGNSTDILKAGLIEDVEQFLSMRSLESQVKSVNTTHQTLLELFLKNPLYHCIVNDPKTNKPVKTLKRPFLRILEDLHQASFEELQNGAKHLLQHDYNFNNPLTSENVEMIHKQMLPLPEFPWIPTNQEMIAWHSPENMELLNRTEKEEDRDVLRLERAREKRMAAQEKLKHAEKSFVRTPTVAAIRSASRSSKGKGKTKTSNDDVVDQGGLEPREEASGTSSALQKSSSVKGKRSRSTSTEQHEHGPANAKKPRGPEGVCDMLQKSFELNHSGGDSGSSKGAAMPISTKKVVSASQSSIGGAALDKDIEMASSP